MTGDWFGTIRITLNTLIVGTRNWMWMTCVCPGQACLRHLRSSTCCQVHGPLSSRL